MGVLSLPAHYEAQSLVGIRRAQSMAMTDQSGYALGTSMYLGQQAVEMQLKSIMLRLDETLKLGSADKILRSLSHEFYPKIYEVYHKHAGKRAQYFIEHYDRILNMDWTKHDVEAHSSYFKAVSDYWNAYRRDRHMQRLTWQYSMGVRLDDADLRRMLAWHKTNPGITASQVGGEDMGNSVPANTGYSEDRIRVAILSARALAPYRLAYAGSPANLHARKALEDTFAEAGVFFMPGARHLVRSDMLGRLGESALLEFGFRVMASAHNIYALLYPHGVIGRYPEILDNGRATPEIYRERVNNALFCLFAAVPHHVEELRENSGLMDGLIGEGRRLGYWK